MVSTSTTVRQRLLASIPDGSKADLNWLFRVGDMVTCVFGDVRALPCKSGQDIEIIPIQNIITSALDKMNQRLKNLN